MLCLISHMNFVNKSDVFFYSYAVVNTCLMSIYVVGNKLGLKHCKCRETEILAFCLAPQLSPTLADGLFRVSQ